MYSVLMVDDEPVILDITKTYLERSQEFTIDPALSATEVLNSPALLSYDAIVSDYQMPEMDGIRFLKEVRSRSPDLPFILFTGKGREDVVIEAINNGADFYIQKGGSPKAQFAELAHKIKKAVEQKRAARALQESEEKFRIIFRTQQIGILMIDANTHQIIDANPYAVGLIGLPRERIVGAECHQFICPAKPGKCPITDLGQTIDLSEQVLINGENREIPIIKAVSVMMIGAKKFLVESFTNISELRQATKALLESEEKFRSLVENSLEGIIIIGMTGTLLFINREAGLMLGGENYKEMVGTSNILHYLYPESYPAAVADLLKVAAGIDNYLVTYRVKLPSGRGIWVECRGQKITYGGSPAVLLSVRDITERREAEEAIRESEEKYRELVETLAEAVFAVDSTMKLTYISPAIGRIAGYHPDEVLGTAFTNYVHGDDVQLLIQRFKDMQGADTIRNSDWRLRKKDGSYAWVRSSSRPVYADGTFAGIRGILADFHGFSNDETSPREAARIRIHPNTTHKEDTS